MMDESPEELQEIRREAEQIDVHKYRRRYRALMTLAVLAFCAAAVWVAIRMAVAGRNPCERVRDYYCRKAPDPAKCKLYEVILKESVEDESARMRGVIRDQCLTKINRLKEEDGVVLE
ncbi:MAG: hypothetical protein JXP73_15290 [Deltaproteobacteria bacterium]|jgi:hypothetical protein|nr:hypothetical protein [Deltaproteobacteria bacterium]